MARAVVQQAVYDYAKAMLFKLTPLSDDPTVPYAKIAREVSQRFGGNYSRNHVYEWSARKGWRDDFVQQVKSGQTHQIMMLKTQVDSTTITDQEFEEKVKQFYSEVATLAGNNHTMIIQLQNEAQSGRLSADQRLKLLQITTKYVNDSQVFRYMVESTVQKTTQTQELQLSIKGAESENHASASS